MTLKAEPWNKLELRILQDLKSRPRPIDAWGAGKLPALALERLKTQGLIREHYWRVALTKDGLEFAEECGECLF